jgi:hypothetical protein
MSKFASNNCIIEDTNVKQEEPANFLQVFLINNDGVNSDERRLKCKECDKTYKNKNSLKSHVFDAHKIIKTTCDGCKRKFTTSIGYEKHKCPQCKICLKKFNGRSSLKIHVYSHFEPKFECDHCGKKVLSKITLKNHIIRKHFTDEIFYKCEHCPKKFVNLLTWKDHVKGCNKPVTCNFCKVKMREDSLKQHILHRHSGLKKNVQCPQCPKKFKTENYVRRHIKKIHFRNQIP